MLHGKATSLYFNSRPSARGDDVAQFQHIRPEISIHAPPRGATCASRRAKNCPANFNSRPSARGDEALANGEIVRIISIHAPPRGATCTAWRGAIPATFQFTPLREGRPPAQPHGRDQRISIHAPPRGATIAEYHGDGEWIFQFTPLREGRRVRRKNSAQQKKFQFTPLREGRRTRRRSRQGLSISIHAPPRGATRLAGCVEDRAFYFNSRPSARGDERLHVGTGISSPISIHAPPRGATHHEALFPAGQDISIHAPPRGATDALEDLKNVMPDFNSRPSARGDRNAEDIRDCEKFQFTPLREGRLSFRYFLGFSSDFNSRPSARGDVL